MEISAIRKENREKRWKKRGAETGRVAAEQFVKGSWNKLALLFSAALFMPRMKMKLCRHSLVPTICVMKMVITCIWILTLAGRNS